MRPNARETSSASHRCWTDARVELFELTIHQALQSLRAGETSAVELTEAYLRRSQTLGKRLNAFATLIISFVMLRSAIFGKVTAYVGIVTGVVMLVPSTAGTIGLVFSLISLVPFAIWCVLIARRLFMLAQGVSKEEAKQPAVA